jgi:Asp-tRNA(Asn)/Glu-tRNA(Gln) amidotransferase A subunit family amidase
VTDTAPSAAEIVDRIAAGATSPEAEVERSLAAVATHDAELNAFSVVLADEARQRARFLDLGPGDSAGPLYGVPVAIK